MKEVLSQKGIDFDYLDITSDLNHLSEFLAIRDTAAEYDGIRETRVGLPCLVKDGKVYLGIPEDLDLIR